MVTRDALYVQVEEDPSGASDPVFTWFASVLEVDGQNVRTMVLSA